MTIPNSHSPQPTRLLLDRARSGDDAAAGALFATGIARLDTYVHARLGPALRQKTEVDDVVQETLLKAFDSLTDFDDRGEGTFAGWLCRIAENVIRNLATHHRAAKRAADVEVVRVTRILATARETAAGPATIAAVRDDGQGLRDALDRLSDELRTVMLLRHFQDCTIDEIAATTNKSASAVRRALGRAMRELGEVLGGQS